MVPGKTYKPEDYLEILWRRKWLAIVPFVVCATGTAIVVQMLPNQFRSEAQVQVVPQQVPVNFVSPTDNTPLDQRLQSISQQILSRTRLERIIQEFDLYREARATEIMEDIVERMRTRDVRIEISRARGRRAQPNSFQVGFQSEDPRTAMQVAERLASMFISENLQARTVRSDQTSQFLQTQLEDANRRLVEHERRMAEFRRQHNGELPSQMQSNVQVMQSTQAQLQATIDSINRDRDQIVSLDKTIEDILNTAATAPGGAGQERTPATAQQQLVAARAALAGLEARYKPDHPNLIHARRAVAELEERAQAEAEAAALNAPLAGDIPTSLPLADQRRVAQLRTQRDAIERRIAQGRAEEVRLQRVLATYRARVEATPTREGEEVELTRDYETIKQTYLSLLAKVEQSNLAADLERRQIGEQFRLIDAPRLPQRPISPNRARLNLMGAAAGLGLGLALIALLAYRDTSMRTDDDVTISLALPVLAVIPAMLTRQERDVARRRRLLAVGASAVMTLGVAAAAAWRLNLIDGWVR